MLLSLSTAPAATTTTTINTTTTIATTRAFSAAETLADRFCIGTATTATTTTTNPNANANKYANLTLSPQWILDCDTTDHGCGGGLLDDAWEFLEKTGVVQETCDPYMYCAHPTSPTCETGPHPPRPTPSQHACPTTCAKNATTTTTTTTTTPPISSGGTGDGGGGLQRFQASSAYAVAEPGDVAAIQREILAHGPVQVGFQVFSDFMTYHNGTYFRTKSAQGPRGGHAVKIVGWGVDNDGVDYWIVANSWSPMWAGLGGFFHIRRGTNECGIETTPAAGLPALSGKQQQVM